MIPSLDVEIIIPTLASLPMAVMTTDCDGVVRWANACLSRLTGYAIDEIVGQNAKMLEPEDTMHPFHNVLQHVVASGEPWRGDSVARRKSGERYDIEWSITPMGDNLFSTVFFDITERKKDAESMKNLFTAIEQVGETIFITDLDGNIQYCNPAFEKVTGYSKEETIGRNVKVLRSGKETPEFYEQLWATIRQGGVWTGRLTNKKKDGSFYEEDASISPIRKDSSELCGFIAVKRDVTERLQLERQFFEAQKLESIGRLAAGIAHDFNNLLTAINGYSDLLLGQLKVGDRLRSYAGEIRKAGEKSASLTKQLLIFSRKQVIEARILNLNTAISDSATMLQRLIGEEITVEKHLDVSLGQVMADPTQIDQVILNLAVNARDAMPDGGKLSLETMNVDVCEVTAAAYPDAMPGPYVLMTVTDNGQGMDDTIRRQIFEPFFTTKEVGKGTGLGLSTVYGIVRRSGGWIDVWSEMGVGTSFKVYLPRVDGCPVTVPKGISAPTGGGEETVLLVEDQESVRSYAKVVLRGYGYHVLGVSNGKRAVAIAKRYSGEIHLLLTDVVLPGMSVKNLSERVKKLRPKVKVLFMSGYPADVIAHRGVLHEGMSYIPKPFSPDELAAKIRGVLGYSSKVDGLNMNAADDRRSDSAAGTSR
jgi:two-component system cell cycle sensor histidine kinase/response regulator CckA